MLGLHVGGISYSPSQCLRALSSQITERAVERRNGLSMMMSSLPSGEGGRVLEQAMGGLQALQ